MLVDEIVLPITEPETEWVRGRALQKMSPTRDHSRLQMKIAFALDAWATGRGEVGPEWRFHVAAPGEPRRPLVPDVAFVSEERLRGLARNAIQAPKFAPTVVVEVLSRRATIPATSRARSAFIFAPERSSRSSSIPRREPSRCTMLRGSRYWAAATFCSMPRYPISGWNSARFSSRRSTGAKASSEPSLRGRVARVAFRFRTLVAFVFAAADLERLG